MHCVLQSILKVSPCRYVEFPTKQFATNETETRKRKRKKRKDGNNKTYLNEMKYF